MKGRKEERNDDNDDGDKVVIITINKSQKQAVSVCVYRKYFILNIDK